MKQMTKTEYWRHLKEQGLESDEIRSVIDNMEKKGVWNGKRKNNA